jgi:hypothetical protein
MSYLVILQTHFRQNLLARNLIIIARHNKRKDKQKRMSRLKYIFEKCVDFIQISYLSFAFYTDFLPPF